MRRVYVSWKTTGTRFHTLYAGDNMHTFASAHEMPSGMIHWTFNLPYAGLQSAWAKQPICDVKKMLLDKTAAWFSTSLQEPVECDDIPF